ncbi:uncharacterized protein DSM5745_10665 [Aspergillus mulundensis]|uniref:Serine hydrolase domain-containing protein n=1 Tax=Aspergillus mulundensis TaxID=1810919 RepID=A0A3D8QHF0_9EURO|nr:Uncharacterized protein DSM5745_10665 [Aspergillus mulundensis]RDW61167.1 Uncharacterized protein DSM5745_10665 [Aspergillus mulundensis]
MPAPLPRIACFHGSGSSAAIYEIQCSFLATLLAKQFTLEFFNGPFPRSAGPGVLPAFADYGPYKSWFEPESDNSKADGSGYDTSGRDGIERVLKLMEERAREKGFGNEAWVGVMGFSQGTRIASGLLLNQQRWDEVEKQGKGKRSVGKDIKLKFGVMCNGGGRPMESEVGFKLDEPDMIVRIPTLHVHGLRDEFLTYGRDQLRQYFDREKAILYEINYHHAMPWVKAESEELARRVTELYKATKD